MRIKLKGSFQLQGSCGLPALHDPVHQRLQATHSLQDICEHDVIVLPCTGTQEWLHRLFAVMHPAKCKVPCLLRTALMLCVGDKTTAVAISRRLPHGLQPQAGSRGGCSPPWAGPFPPPPPPPTLHALGNTCDVTWLRLMTAYLFFFTGRRFLHWLQACSRSTCRLGQGLLEVAPLV